MNEKLQRLKDEYDAVEIPLKLDDIVSKAFGQTPPKKNRPFPFKAWSGGIAAAAVLLLMVSLNTFPNLAGSMLSVPILGDIAELLTFREFQVADQSQAPEDMVKLYSVQDSAPKDSELAESTAEGQSSVTHEEAGPERSPELMKSFMVADSGTSPTANVSVGSSRVETSSVDPWQDMAAAGEAIPYTEKVNRSKPPEEILHMPALSQTADTDVTEEELEGGISTPLSELFLDDRYIKRINSAIMEEIASRVQQSTLNKEANIAWNFSGISANQAYYIDETGLIVIVFAPGEIAPIEAGTVEVPIPNTCIVDLRIPPQL